MMMCVLTALTYKKSTGMMMIGAASVWHIVAAIVWQACIRVLPRDDRCVSAMYIE